MKDGPDECNLGGRYTGAVPSYPCVKAGWQLQF
jgi:hypothetical protein